MLNNAYDSVKDRISFNIQAVACKQSVDRNCADEKDIKYLLERIYFTVYVLEDKVQFKTDLELLPYETINKFHS